MPTIAPEELVSALRWRYAVKRFDPAKRISPELWSALEDTLVLTPSSIGLQPWRFVVVTDQAVKANLRPAAYGQAQVADCSHFVVMAVRRELGAEHVDRHVARMSEVRGITVESLAKFRTMATGNLEKARQEARLDTWQTYQIYIALGNFMTAAALVGVDTCPMEGFDPAKTDDIVGLTGTDYASVVCCAAGYRHAEDKYAATPKVRFPKEALFVHL
ncbi:MAG: NAD(P)H-dependent oxidoreductase [Opitutaceae bacterium]|nr:NAD(P)H-dependent oxidoreductase [Opitutaceae bacterium]